MKLTTRCGTGRGGRVQPGVAGQGGRGRFRGGGKVPDSAVPVPCRIRPRSGASRRSPLSVPFGCLLSSVGFGWYAQSPVATVCRHAPFRGLGWSQFVLPQTPVARSVQDLVSAHARGDMDESVIGAERRGGCRARGSWPARPGEMPGMRAALRSWLSQLCLDPVTVDRLVMAAHEAACNAVQHAYPTATGDNGARGTVDIALHTERTSVCVEITDHGNWREPAVQPIGRGLGIPLMQRLVASVLIQKDGRGARVLLRYPISGLTVESRSIDSGLLSRRRGLCAMSSADPGLVVELVRRAPDQCVLAVSGGCRCPHPGCSPARCPRPSRTRGGCWSTCPGCGWARRPQCRCSRRRWPAPGGWPATRLVLFGAGADLARTLTALRVTSTVPLAGGRDRRLAAAGPAPTGPGATPRSGP